MLYCNKEHTSGHFPPPPPPHFLFAQDKEQGTPLHAAAYLGDVNTMELLIASGKKPHSEFMSKLDTYHQQVMWHKKT